MAGRPPLMKPSGALVARRRRLLVGLVGSVVLVGLVLLLHVNPSFTSSASATWGGGEHAPSRRFLLQETTPAATTVHEEEEESEILDRSGIYDSDSELKVKVTNARMMGLGNDEIHDFKFFMKVKDMGFFHESKFAPGNQIKAHAHKGDILNFVLDGSVKINGKLYNKGDWYLVSKNTRYSGAIGPHGARALMFCSFAEDTGDAAHIEAWVYHENRKSPSSSQKKALEP